MSNRMTAAEHNAFPNGRWSPPAAPSDWEHRSSDGVQMWIWRPERGVSYMVTQHADNIQAHVTTGTAHKFSTTIGSFVSVSKAQEHCREHYRVNKEAA